MATGLTGRAIQIQLPVVDAMSEAVPRPFHQLQAVTDPVIDRTLLRFVAVKARGTAASACTLSHPDCRIQRVNDPGLPFAFFPFFVCVGVYDDAPRRRRRSRIRYDQ